MEAFAHLGVNIDHVATLRQLRGTPYPGILDAARLCEAAGARQITVHLREDRRHIQDADVKLLRSELKIVLNLEMAIADSIVGFAVKTKPDWACLVPEKRQEVTTEGGLDIVQQKRKVGAVVKKLQKAGIRVSLFVEPDLKIMKMAKQLGAEAVELHTGRYCLARQNAFGKKSTKVAETEFKRIHESALLAKSLGLRVHAGHGFDLENVRDVAQLKDLNGAPLVEEFNIGHSIVCRAVLVGLEQAVREMRRAVEEPGALPSPDVQLR